MWGEAEHQFIVGVVLPRVGDVAQRLPCLGFPGADYGVLDGVGGGRQLVQQLGQGGGLGGEVLYGVQGPAGIAACRGGFVAWGVQIFNSWLSVRRFVGLA